MCSCMVWFGLSKEGREFGGGLGCICDAFYLLCTTLCDFRFLPSLVDLERIINSVILDPSGVYS